MPCLSTPPVLKTLPSVPVVLQLTFLEPIIPLLDIVHYSSTPPITIPLLVQMHLLLISMAPEIPLSASVDLRLIPEAVITLLLDLVLYLPIQQVHVILQSALVVWLLIQQELIIPPLGTMHY